MRSMQLAATILVLCIAQLLPVSAHGDNASTKIASETVATLPASKLQVKLHTNRGDIVIELWPEKAPQTVQNFLRYVDEGFYSGTIFHRIVRNKMIQGGGYTRTMELKTTHDPIGNESRPRQKHERGTVAMARLENPNSATTQFFINARRNTQFESKDRKTGYAIFGEVIEGMDVVENIAAEKTHKLGSYNDVPFKVIMIISASRVTPAAPQRAAAE